MHPKGTPGKKARKRAHQKAYKKADNKTKATPETSTETTPSSALEAELRAETEKWLSRLEQAYSRFSPTGKLPNSELRPVRENIEAYIKDSRHFLGQGDLIRAFEAVVYAWGLLEASQHLGLVKK